MKKTGQIQMGLLYCIFIFYILLLIKILFLSRVSLSELFNSNRPVFMSVNLIPLHSIMQYMNGGTDTLRRFAFANVVGNVVIFIPMGIFLPILKKDKRTAVNLLFIFLISLFVEIIQGLLGLGVTDIDDVILNCLGGWIGILGYKFLLYIIKDNEKVKTVITILSFCAGLPVILYLLFMVRMRL